MTQGTTGFNPSYNWSADTVGGVLGDQVQTMSTEDLYFAANLIFMKTGDDALQKVTDDMTANIDKTEKYNNVLKAATKIEKEMSTKGTDTLANVLLNNPQLEQDFNDALKAAGMAPFSGHTGSLGLPADMNFTVNWPEVPKLTEKEREWLMKLPDGKQLITDYEKSYSHHFVVSEGETPPNWRDHVNDLSFRLDGFTAAPLTKQEAKDLDVKIKSFQQLQTDSTLAWKTATTSEEHPNGLDYNSTFPDLAGGIDSKVKVSEFSMFMVDLKGKIDINGKELQQIMVKLQQAMQKLNFATEGFSSGSKSMQQTKEKVLQGT